MSDRPTRHQSAAALLICTVVVLLGLGWHAYLIGNAIAVGGIAGILLIAYWLQDAEPPQRVLPDQHVPTISRRRDLNWGVFCVACSHDAGDYVYPCRRGGNEWDEFPHVIHPEREEFNR